MNVRNVIQICLFQNGGKSWAPSPRHSSQFAIQYSV